MDSTVKAALRDLFPGEQLDSRQQSLARWVPYAWKVLDLGVYVSNLELLGQRAGGNLLLSMKSRFYGNQDSRRSPVLPLAARAAGIRGFCVAGINEARDLRDCGMDEDRIILLYRECAEGGNIEEALELDVELFVTSMEEARDISDLVMGLCKSRGEDIPCARIHVFADTGMSRGGLPARDAGEIEQTVESILSINALPGLNIVGLAMHFAAADAKDVTSAKAHFANYLQILTGIYTAPDGKAVRPECLHVANSAALLQLPETLDPETYRQAVGDEAASFTIFARPGIITTGVTPSTEVTANLAALGQDLPGQEITSCFAEVTQVITLKPGQSAGYSARYTNTTDQDQILYLIALGYADGMQRVLADGQRLPVLINGKRYWTTSARTSMNSFYVFEDAATALVRPGDIAVLIGRQGDDLISINEWARGYGTIEYEVLLRLQLPATYYALPDDPGLYLYDDMTNTLIRSTSLRRAAKSDVVYISTGLPRAVASTAQL